MKETLEKIDLTPDNCVVIGSGILQALGIRQSHDIDVVAKEEIYSKLKETGKFEIEQNHGREILKDDTFEIGTSWFVLDKAYRFEDFEKESVMIDGVRYITLDFLLRVKKSWVTEGTVRDKDLNDIKLIEEYIENKYPQNTWTWNGNKVKSTWIRTNDVTSYSPRTQVYGIVFNNKDEILICRKGDGAWQIPGGHPEKGETIKQILKRELLEEVDATVDNIQILGVQKAEFPDESDKKPHYQVRCIAKLKKLQFQTPDPDNGETWERKFIPASKITNYVKWGVTGEAMFKDAIKLWKSYETKER